VTHLRTDEPDWPATIQLGISSMKPAPTDLVPVSKITPALPQPVLSFDIHLSQQLLQLRCIPSGLLTWGARACNRIRYKQHVRPSG
jgi:hypothetical protein